MQVTKVPEVLPATRAGRRPVPTFAGVSIVPLRRSLYSSTLSQLALSASFAAPADLGPQVQVRELHDVEVSCQALSQAYLAFRLRLRWLHSFACLHVSGCGSVVMTRSETCALKKAGIEKV